MQRELAMSEHPPGRTQPGYAGFQVGGVRSWSCANTVDGEFTGLIPCSADDEARWTESASGVTCPICRNVLAARVEFRRTVSRLIPYPRQ